MGIVMLNNKILMSGSQMALYIPPIVPKGSLVKMNLDGTERQYRVLSVNGNVCKVLGMWDDFTGKYNETSTTTTFGSTTAQKYEGSTLDTYLNITWYNTLNNTAKAAIVPENVIQYCYKRYGEPNKPNTPTYTYQYQYNWSDSNYENADNVGNVVVGNRNVFALDLKDIFDYFEKVCITSDELMTMFWNSTNKVSKYPWLRSSYADFSIEAWYVDGSNGSLNQYYANGSNIVRPALNLDMSKIQYTLVQAPPVIETETWVIKDNAPVGAASQTLATTNIPFTTNSQKATSIGVMWDGLVYVLVYGGIGEVAGFEPGTSGHGFEWDNEAYKTLVFDTPPTGDLLTWLQANATKQ